MIATPEKPYITKETTPDGRTVYNVFDGQKWHPVIVDG